MMKKQGKAVLDDSESRSDRQKESCQKAAKVAIVVTAPTEAVSLLNINALPDLPFEVLFGWIPLGDLLSAQFVCHKWQEASVGEASINRDSITLCIDGQAEDQKTARYLERSVWNLPHAEVLKADDGKPLYPDYVPHCKRSSFNKVLLGTRLENPFLLDETLETAQKRRKWQANYDRSFEALLDQKVSQLLTLITRGPRTLTIVCRSEHRDFLRLLPLLTNWKENLITLNLYSSHPQAMDSEQCASHYCSSHLVHVSNRPLRDALNCMSSLRHLTLDLLGEEGDTLFDGLHKFSLSEQLEDSGELLYELSNFTFFTRLESFTFADRNYGEMVWWLLSASTVSSPPPSLRALQLGNSLPSTNGLSFRKEVLPFSPFMSHLHIHSLLSAARPRPWDVRQGPSPFASLRSLFLNLLKTKDTSLSLLLQYLTLTVGLVHLRLHLTHDQVAHWYRKIATAQDCQCPQLPRLRVFSLILVDNQPIDHRVPFIFQRLFPSLQVFVIHQRLIGLQPQQPTQFLEPYFASIRRHFSEAHFLASSSLLLLEARLFLYKEPNYYYYLRQYISREKLEHGSLLQSQEHIWSAEELRTSFFPVTIGSDH